MAVDWDKMPAPKGGPVPLPLDAPKRVKHSLSPGDHIYCNRDKAADLYSHHGIYVGDSKVIHFASDSSQAGYPRKDSIDSRFIRIMRGTLSGFTGSDTLEIVEYNSEISVKERVELETGSCHRVDAMPRNETLKVGVFRRKIRLVGLVQFVQQQLRKFRLFLQNWASGHSVSASPGVSDTGNHRDAVHISRRSNKKIFEKPSEEFSSISFPDTTFPLSKPSPSRSGGPLPEPSPSRSGGPLPEPSNSRSGGPLPEPSNSRSGGPLPKARTRSFNCTRWCCQNSSR